MFFFTLNILFLLTIIHQSITSDWNYDDHGPDVWSDEYPLCAKHAQSPINIRTACTVYQSFETFDFSSDYDQLQDFILINNGHTISGKLTSNDPSLLTLIGGGLSGTYEFSSFHFHWGENYKSGSEHQVNNEKYAGELHLIHVNPTTKQTAVLGIFLQSNKRHVRKSLTSTNSTLSEWENFFLASESLQKVNDSIILNLNLAKLININLKEFWRYTGSLTTPPCSEGIIWTVFKQPILVDDHLFQSFRNNLYSKDYREPQPLYNRIVYRNFLYDITPLTSDSNCCSNNFI